MITFYCGKCGVKVRVPAVDAGKTTRCDECRAKLPVPRTYFDRPQMRFFCPACETRVRAWADQAGESMKCPNCEVLIDLPDIAGEYDPDIGARHPDEWLPPSDVTPEPEEEPADESPTEAEPAPQEKAPARRPIRSRRRTRRMIVTAACLLSIPVAIGSVVYLRCAHPAWLDRSLEAAAETGQCIGARLLLLCGADVESTDGAGRTLLHLASGKGHTPFVELLLTQGVYADPQDKAGETPLFLAVVGGHGKIAELLVNAGADINFRRPSDGRRLLDIAIASGYRDIADLLLRKREEARQKEAASAVYLSPEEQTKSAETKSVRPSPKPFVPSLPRLKGDRLMPVGFYMTYMVKIGIRRLWGAKGEGQKKFVVVVFMGPLNMFKVSEYEFRYMKSKDPKLTSPGMTRSYDPGRFVLVLPSGRRARGSAICPQWTPVEELPTSNIFHYDLNVSYKSEAELRRGDLAVAWLLDADECKPPFQVRIDGGESMPVPNIRFDGGE